MYVPKESQPKQGGGASGKVKDGKRKIVAQNKKARHDYAIIDTYEAGLVLTGTEVKSLRQGRASLTDGFVQIDGNEAWLHNAHIPEYSQGTWTNHTVRRKRKLLLHREEIDKLASKSEETGHTIVPLALYFKDGRAKAEIALARVRRSTTSGRPCGRSRTGGSRTGRSRRPSASSGASRAVGPRE
ncbi:hypothetical protein SAV31267_040480 [Streptomyces avermitilis]|uniref:SsrA-binding protein n=1 Tax=Streptomyces avermitilis TaxID=33903 RepID=A0A4D4MR22_STRAX|nr:hypothetical protein SAV31267_040480 [Streptomyces avermitilis]